MADISSLAAVRTPARAPELLHAGHRGPALLLLLLLGSGVACNNLWIDPMKQQPKFKAYSANPMFKDGRAMRVPLGGTYSREIAYDDPALSGGDPDAGVFLDHFPMTVDAALVTRGQERFNINCLPCHGADGSGESIVAKKMILRSPPSLLTQDIRALPDGKIEEVIRVGYGLMNPYGSQVTSQDRWAIVAYVRALQISHDAPLDEAPPTERQKLMTEREQ